MQSITPNKHQAPWYAYRSHNSEFNSQSSTKLEWKTDRGAEPIVLRRRSWWGRLEWTQRRWRTDLALVLAMAIAVLQSFPTAINKFSHFCIFFFFYFHIPIWIVYVLALSFYNFSLFFHITWLITYILLVD